MPAKVKKPVPGKTPGLKPGLLPGMIVAPTDIAGTPPTEVLDRMALAEARQGSQKLHPLGFAVRQSSIQSLRPSSPFGFSVRNLAATARGEDLDEATFRRLATLPEAEQGRVLGALRAGGFGVTDASVNESLDSYQAGAMSPGAWTTELADAYLRSVSRQATQSTITEDERAEARGELIGGGGTDAPEPTEEEILETVAEIRAERAQDEGFLYQGVSAPEYAPAEEFFEAEQEE